MTMSIFRKLNTLVRAGARETAEQITDANAIRIYRQEVVDAENLLNRRRACLAAIIATRKDLEKEITTAQTRIQSRERQVAGLEPPERTEELLLLAAKDIAATESHLAALRRRHGQVAERVNAEELVLRKLVTELREHRREVTILASQVRGNRRPLSDNYNETVAGHVANLRDTRAGITGAIVASEHAEAGMDEAIERVDGDPLDRQLSAMGRDDDSLHLESVLARLRSIDTAA
jgi:chromosome segregation ATPase